MAEDSAATAIDVLANDTDAPDTGETLTVTAVTQPAARHGDASRRRGVTLHAGAELHRHRHFTYTISDGNGGTATATVTSR